MSRLKMRRIKGTVLLLFLTTVLAIVFQNCGYQPTADFGEDLSSYDECEVTPCVSPGPAADQLKATIENHTFSRGTEILYEDPITHAFLPFDLGGYCDAGGYPDNHIYYSLQPLGSPPLWMAAGATCDSLGRYRILVQLPGGFNRCIPHEVRVQIRGVRSTGEEVGPSAGNTNEASIQLLNEYLIGLKTGC